MDKNRDRVRIFLYKLIKKNIYYLENKQDWVRWVIKFLSGAILLIKLGLVILCGVLPLQMLHKSGVGMSVL